MPALSAFKPFLDGRTLTDMERFEIATSLLRAPGTEDDVVPGGDGAAPPRGLGGLACRTLGSGLGLVIG
jgi:hypothetical protein